MLAYFIDTVILISAFLPVGIILSSLEPLAMEVFYLVMV